MNGAFVGTDFGRVHIIDVGAGTPILLGHTVGASLRQFDASYERLAAANFRVIAWDLIGHGDSDPRPRHMTIHDHARTAIAVLDALTVDRAHFVGCSVGGMIGVELAVNFADRLEKAVIVDTQLRTPEWWTENWSMVEDIFTTVTEPFERVASRFRSLTLDQFRRSNIDRAKTGAATMMDLLWAGREYDLIGAVPKIGVPTMKIFGENGPAVSCIDEFRRLLPESRVEVMSSCGHFPMVDDPEAFDALVVDFLGSRS